MAEQLDFDRALRMCFSKVRFLSPLLRDRLHQEGVWEDLRQEMHLAAWEAVEKGLDERETFRLAARRIYTFLKANGYRAYRHGYCKMDRPLSLIAQDVELQEIVLAKASANPAPAFVGWRDGLEEEILTILRKSPLGLSKRELYRRLGVSARELDYHCAPLVERGLIREVKRETLRGRPTPLLVAGPTRIPKELTVNPKKERIRQAFCLEHKRIRQIASELHCCRKMVRRVIYGEANMPGWAAMTTWQRRVVRETARWWRAGCFSCGGGLRDWDMKYGVCFFCKERLRTPAERQFPGPERSERSQRPMHVQW